MERKDGKSNFLEKNEELYLRRIELDVVGPAGRDVKESACDATHQQLVVDFQLHNRV